MKEFCNKKVRIWVLAYRENTDDPVRLQNLIDGFSAVAQAIPIVLPLYPRTSHALERTGIRGKMSKRMYLIDPVGYLDMVMLEKNAVLIATDSGGVQKEAFFLRVPCVTLRDETEWVELVELGWNRVVPPLDPYSIQEALLDKEVNHPCQPPSDLYGGGHAVERIARCFIF